MNKILSILAVVLTLGFSTVAMDAEAAKRMGSGKSMGTQRQATADKAPAAPAQASAATAGAGAAAAAADDAFCHRLQRILPTDHRGGGGTGDCARRAAGAGGHRRRLASRHPDRKSVV